MAIEPNTVPVSADQVKTRGWFNVFAVLGIFIIVLVMFGAVFQGGWGIYDTFIKEYETLISGLLALLGAIITVIVLRTQINQGETHHRESRDKKFAAARAVLPLALSELRQYAEESIQYTVKKKKETITDSPPTIPENLIPVLRDLVEYGNTGISSITCKLISDIQIHRSRMLSSETDLLDATIRDAAMLIAFSENFYEYARLKTATLPKRPTYEQVCGRLFDMGIEKSFYPNVFNPDVESD